MSLYDDLVNGRALIADRAHWTQNALYVDTPDGPAYCDNGAAFAAIGGEFDSSGHGIWSGFFDDRRYSTVIRALFEALPKRPATFLHAGFYVANFNNSHTHEENLALWDRAIEANKPAEFIEQETEELVPA